MPLDPTTGPTGPGATPTEAQQIYTPGTQLYPPGTPLNPAPPPPPPQQQAPPPPPANPTWVFAVNMPSTYPDFAAMKAAGAGLVVVADDPNAAILVAGARQWGIPLSIQVNAPSGITPQDYAARVAAAKAQFSPDKLVLDIEDVGKGYSGSSGWNWSTQAAALLKSATGGTSVAVTMPPIQDDYNYAAYKTLGAQFWVQSYYGDMSPVDANTAKQTLINNGVNPNSITTILGPGQSAPAGTGQWASYGIPTTSAGGIYSGYAPTGGQPGGQPTSPNNPPEGTGYPGGTGSGTTVTPSNPGGGTNNPGSGPGTITVPPIPPGGFVPEGEDWASVYFGNLGLPQDVINQVDAIFRKYDDPNVASQFALAYIRGTAWYSQTFPGIEAGIKKGIINDERDYRQYVTELDALSMRYWDKHVSGGQVADYLTQGFTPDTVGRQFQGLANVMANGADYQYYLGAFGNMRPDAGTEGHGTLNTDSMRALGNEQAGLDSPLGQKLTRAFTQAMQKYQTIFNGQNATPSLSLNKAGQLSAPSLASNTNDTGA